MVKFFHQELVLDQGELPADVQKRLISVEMQRIEARLAEVRQRQIDWVQRHPGAGGQTVSIEEETQS